MSETHFTIRFNNLAQKRGPFCLGIDPTSRLLTEWGLEVNYKGLAKMCQLIAKAAGNKLSMVKPQAAYFEKFGPEGMAVLRDLVEVFHEQDTLVLLDAKRGDIGSTSLAYAEAYLGKNSIYKFDAITFNAYLGFDALIDTLNYAQEVKAGIFLVVKSSNPEGAIIQDAIIKNGNTQTTVADYLATQIYQFNHQYLANGIGPIGAVIGATLNNIDNILEKLKTSLILMPGIGYQGAKIEELLTTCHGHTKRIIPISAREVLSIGNNSELLSNKISHYCKVSLKFLED